MYFERVPGKHGDLGPDIKGLPPRGKAFEIRPQEPLGLRVQDFLLGEVLQNGLWQKHDFLLASPRHDRK